MSNMIADAVTWLAGVQKQYASQSVTYSRGASSVTVSAVIGQTAFELEDATLTSRTYHSRDFIILAADLVLSSTTITPARGDKIREVVGSVTHVYEVLQLPGVPAFEPSDQSGTRYRIHTKKIDTE